MAKLIRCFRCGKTFKAGNRADGLPNGVGFEDKEGNIVNVCTECLMQIGQEAEHRKEK